MNKEENPLWKHFSDELKAWLRSEKSESFADDDAEEILHDLSVWILKGDIDANRENQSLFDLIETKYPIGLNRIDWEYVDGHKFEDVLRITAGQTILFSEQINKLGSIRNHLKNLVSNSINEKIVWIGDGCDLRLSMKKETFLDCYPILFSSPQHSYVLPLSFDWCLNYTMEGHLYFGYSANSIQTGFESRGS